MTAARPGLLAVVALVFPSPAVAAPRDEALRLAPQDAALVAVVQNARDHARAVAASPFAAWFPTTALGKQLVGDDDALKALTRPLDAVLAGLGTTTDEVLNDVLGDALVFAYTPPGKGTPEQAVILVRPGKPETLARLVDRLNAEQKKSGEVKAVVRKLHHGEPYFAREKAGGAAEFYCFRGPVFAYSSTEADVTAVIDRDRAAAKDAEPELTATMRRLGVADALGVLLVNPRRLDAELDARIADAGPDERAVLLRFREVWTATDAAAAYLAVGRDLEAGVSVRFDPAKVPAWAKGWLTGERTPSALWAAIPDDALAAVGGRFRAAELLQLVLVLLPDDGKKAVNSVLTDALGPVVGRDKLPLVLDALGPDWAVWAEPPRGDGFPPVPVAAVRIDGTKPEAGSAILDAVEYGFRTFRVVYNAGHADQIDIRRTQDGDVTITSLVNDKGFPPGVRPSFAMKGGYLVVAGDPDAIRRFRPPTTDPKPGGEVVLARFNGPATRHYLEKNGPRLAGFLGGLGAGDEKQLADLTRQLVVALEPLDRVEVVTRGDEASLRVAVRVKLVKPLRP